MKIKANELAINCLEELKQKCDDEVNEISKDRIEKAVDSLLEVLPQTRKVCIGITQKSCLDRVKQWIDSHITLGTFELGLFINNRKFRSF